MVGPQPGMVMMICQYLESPMGETLSVSISKKDIIHVGSGCWLTFLALVLSLVSGKSRKYENNMLITVLSKLILMVTLYVVAEFILICWHLMLSMSSSCYWYFCVEILST